MGTAIGRGTHPLDEPVSLSVTILAAVAPSNESFRVWSVVSSDRPSTNRVLVGPVNADHTTVNATFGLLHYM